MYFAWACGLAVIAISCLGFITHGYKFSMYDNRSDFLSHTDSGGIVVISIIGVVTAAISVGLVVGIISSWFGG